MLQKKPTIFCPNILSIIFIQSASRTIWKLSNIKVEKVVKAPINPTRITSLPWAGINPRSSERVQTSPKRKQPIIFTDQVPQGKSLPKKLYTAPESQYLARVPNVPAIESKIILFMKVTCPLCKKQNFTCFD